MTDASKFDDIRPYYDHEVRPVIERLLYDKELAEAVLKLRFPRLGRYLAWALRPLIRRVLRKQVAGVNSIKDFQMVIEKYMQNMFDTTTSGFTHSGLDHLKKDKAYLFISNHRDIAMDPALVCFALHHGGFDTVDIAIGDNLLSKPFVSDLMRLNRCFVVNRSANTSREKLKNSKHLSSYIRHALQEKNENIWIAQRQGRAKDGLDKTNSAIIRMFSLSKGKKEDYSKYIESLNIVPVAISYEWDPCDKAKARELYVKATDGEYAKAKHEDVKSIAKGIAGQKGQVHVSFGEPLRGEWDSFEAVADEIDEHIHENYVLYPSNAIAYYRLTGEIPKVPVTHHQKNFDPKDFEEDALKLDERLCELSEGEQAILLQGYANSVISYLNAMEKK